MRIKRIEEVEAYIRQVGSVSIQDLCDEFHVSINTIRRDIDTLVQSGRVKKVYGGVIALGQSEEDASAPQTRELMDFEVRNREYRDEKKEIARRAAEFVNHGDTIFLDSGSTTLQMIPYLAEKKNITVVTYSIPALAELAKYPQIRAVALPGVVLGRTASLVGSSTCQALQQFNCSKAFMGCTGLSLTRQLTNATFEEFGVKQTALRQSKSHYLLADHEKFGHAALMTYGNISDMDYVITNEEPEQEYLEYFKEHRVELVLTEE
ncbi:MAG: DeoR/GlpR transcriptional regulator [Peptococcaceae bacterium]|nr:DeoR/GlpR transcriptional regulator [Peptococcaceae bacterium]